MVYKMNRSYFSSQSLLIWNFSNQLQNLKGTHIPKTLLPFFAESHHPFHRSNIQIHLITHFKFKVSSFIIGVRILRTIGYFKPIPNNSNFLHRVIEYLANKGWILTKVIPPNWIPKSPTIEYFKRSHINNQMVVIIISELNQWQVIVQVPLEVYYIKF